MLLVLLLLFAAFGVDSMYGFTKKGYGEDLKIYLLSSAHKITFTNDHHDKSTLWTLAGGSVSRVPRYHLTESFFLIRRLTQQDSGQYHTWNRHDVLLSSADIRIEPNERSHHLSEGDSVSFDFDLQRDHCNVFFTSHSTNERVRVVYRGRLESFTTCGAIRLNTCKIILHAVETSCLGTFDFTDDNDDVASKVAVTVEPGPLIPVYSLVGIGAAVAAALCCCVKCVCCGKTKKKKENLKTEDAVDDAELTHVHGPCLFVHNTVQLGPRELGELPDSRPPPVAPTAPLIHDAPVVDAPCFEKAVTVPTPEGSLRPLSSSFEFSGVRFSADPGLGSEGTSCEVYTSDKLNFL